MALSQGDALRMMQTGGVDQTGFAGMADAVGTPGLDIIEERRREAAEAAALNALYGGDETGDETGETDSDLVFGPLFEDLKGKTQSEIYESPDLSFPRGSYEQIVEDYSDPGGAINESLGFDRSDLLGQGYELGTDLLRYGLFPGVSTLLEPTVLDDETLYGNEFEYAPPEVLDKFKYVDQAEGGRVGYAEGGRVDYGKGKSVSKKGSLFEDLFYNKKHPYLSGLATSDLFDLLQTGAMSAGPLFGLEDGGRVGMQQGGFSTPSLLGVASGSSGNLFNNYTPSAAVPGPNYGTTAGPNYNTYQVPPLTSLGSPYAGPQFGDIGNYLGGPDPFQTTYDPYAGSGNSAYDQYDIQLGQDEIDEHFKDIDKYSVQAQAKKAEAEAAALKSKQRLQDEIDYGQGPNWGAGDPDFDTGAGFDSWSDLLSGQYIGKGDPDPNPDTSTSTDASTTGTGGTSPYGGGEGGLHSNY